MTRAPSAARPRRRHATVRESAVKRDARSLYNALSQLARVLQFRDRDCICCHDVSVTQCSALGILASEGPLTLNELAAALYLEKSTACRVVDALERKGYVSRRRHRDDRRAVLLGASVRGRKLYQQIESDLLNEHARLLAGFDPAVRRAATELIDRLASAAAAGVETGGGRCCVRE